MSLISSQVIPICSSISRVFSASLPFVRAIVRYLISVFLLLTAQGYAGSLFTKSLCFQDRFSSVLFCVSEDYRSLILCNFDLLSGKCHQKVVNNDDKTDGCCRFAEMFQKFVVTAALDYRLTDPISVCLEMIPV